MTFLQPRQLLVAGLLVCASAATHAEDRKVPDKPAAPTLGQVLEASGITINGYIDTSYTSLSGSGTFTSGVPNRVFDTERRSFNLHAVDIDASALPEQGFGGRLNLTAGSNARVIGAAGTTADDFDVTQAYVHYGMGSWMLMGGKYVTASGAEVIKSPANTNFSRSILFGYAIPFTHTGVRASFTPGGNAVAPEGKWTFIAGVNNGWDVQSESQQAAAADGTRGLGKTIELGANGNLTKSASLSAVYYSGNESTGAFVPASTGTRNLLDLVATYNVTDKLSLVLNYDTAEQEKALAGGGSAKWNGVAGYVNYTISDFWRVSFRTEAFDDKNGFRTGVTQKWKENTLTLAATPSKSAELRFEVRDDRSDAASFNQPSGAPKKSQNSLGMEAIYKF